jgi:hypothetical protein
MTLLDPAADHCHFELSEHAPYPEEHPPGRRAGVQLQVNVTGATLTGQTDQVWRGRGRRGQVAT